MKEAVASTSTTLLDVLVRISAPAYLARAVRMGALSPAAGRDGHRVATRPSEHLLEWAAEEARSRYCARNIENTGISDSTRVASLRTFVVIAAERISEKHKNQDKSKGRHDAEVRLAARQWNMRLKKGAPLTLVARRLRGMSKNANPPSRLY